RCLGQIPCAGRLLCTGKPPAISLNVGHGPGLALPVRLPSMDRLAPTRARTFAGPAADASTATGTPYRATMFLAVATCVLVPAYTIRWHRGPLPTPILDIAILLTFAAFVLESIRESVRPIWHTRVTLPVLVFLIAGATSVFVAPDHRAAPGLYRAYFVDPIGFGSVL